MKTAIVILNWNGQKMMERFLPTVLKYSRNDAEVWVADNASTDNSMEMLAQKFPEVKTLVLDRNYGFADGYNRALRQIEADYYVLLNSDVEVTHHWLTPLQEYMDSHDDVAACQPKLLSEADKDSFEYAGASGGFLDRFGYPLCRGRVFDTVERDNGQYDYKMDVLWATGACLMIRAKDYWEAGALDARFFAHNEEIDLCWRLRQRGRRVVCDEDFPQLPQQPDDALQKPPRRGAANRNAHEMDPGSHRCLGNTDRQPQLARLHRYPAGASRFL